jgi:hypothetical protein
MGIQNAVPWTDLDSPEVQAAVAELHDQVFGTSRDDATSRPRPRPGPGRPAGSKQVQRRLPPEEVEELIASHRAGATALVLAGKHSIHRTTVLALLERHGVSRRGRVATATHLERAAALYASGRSCASIARELQVSPETIRQALLRIGVAMRRPGRPGQAPKDS